METLVAARVLARELSLTSLLSGKNKKFTLREVLSACVDSSEPETPEQLVEGLERLLAEVGRLKGSVLRGERLKDAESEGEEGLTMEEMIKFSGLERAEFEKVYLSWVDSEHLSLFPHCLQCVCANLKDKQSMQPASNCTSAQSTSTQRRYAYSASARFVWLLPLPQARETSSRGSVR